MQVPADPPVAIAAQPLDSGELVPGTGDRVEVVLSGQAPRPSDHVLAVLKAGETAGQRVLRPNTRFRALWWGTIIASDKY